MMLEHIDLVEGLRVCKPPDVPSLTITGHRGGIRIPRRVVWKPRGTGLFMFTRKGPDGETHPSLFPFVEYTNGKSSRLRYEPADDWLEQIPSGGPVLPRLDAPILALHNEFEATVEASRSAQLQVEAVCGALSTTDDLDGEVERQLLSALATRRRTLALVGSCVIRLLAAGQIKIAEVEVPKVEVPKVKKPEVKKPEPKVEIEEPKVEEPKVEVETPKVETPKVEVKPEPKVTKVLKPEPKIEAPRPYPASYVSAGPPPDSSPEGILKNVLDTVRQMRIFDNPVTTVLHYNTVATEILDLVQYTDQWASLDQGIQRALVGLVASLARHLQDEVALDHSSLVSLSPIFSRLTSFSASYRPGFVRGLTRTHEPLSDTWAEDSHQWYRELSEKEANPAPPRVWSSSPTPRIVEDEVEEEPEQINPERSLSALRHLLDAEEPDRDAICNASMTCLAAGVRPADPRLVRMLGAHLELLTKEPSLKNLRKAIRESQKEAEDEARTDNSAPPEEWPCWSYTRGKRLLILGGDARNTASNRLQKTFGFSEILWETGHQTRRVQAAVAQVSAGRFDMVLFLARFVSHAAWDAAVPVCKAAEVPFVLVESGYGTTQIRASIEQALGGFSQSK